MKICVVLVRYPGESSWDENSRIVNIYSSEEKAKAFIENTPWPSDATPRIEEYDLDPE